MKSLALCLLFIFIVFGCGPINDKKQTNSNKIQPLSGYMLVQLNKPISDLEGASLVMVYNQKEYKVGFASDNKVLEQLKRLSAGEYTFYIDGDFSEESGHLPNQSQNYNVIHVQKILSPEDL